MTARMLRVDVDPNGTFVRGMSDLEKRLAPYATASAINSVAFQVHQRWKGLMPEVFDNPVAMTRNAALYTKAKPSRLYADIFIRDEASKGTPPSKYLFAQSEGGQRGAKGIERHLQAVGVLPSGMYAVPGMEAKLDAHGNIPRSQVNQIKSQLGAQSDAYANQSDTSRRRRHRREAKQGGPTTDLVAFSRTVGKRAAGVYRRFNFALGSAIRPVLLFVSKAVYQRRLPIQSEAERIYNETFPREFDRNFRAAMERAMARAQR